MPGRRHPHRQRPRPTNLPSLKKGQLCRSTWKSFPVRRAPHEGGFSGGPARSACHAGVGARSHHSASDAMGQAPTSTSDSRCRSTSRCSRTPTLRRALRRHGPVPRLRRRLRLHPAPAPALIVVQAVLHVVGESADHFGQNNNPGATRLRSSRRDPYAWSARTAPFRPLTARNRGAVERLDGAGSL